MFCLVHTEQNNKDTVPSKGEAVENRLGGVADGIEMDGLGFTGVSQ